MNLLNFFCEFTRTKSLKKQILIIDDDEMIRLTLLEVLEAFEFNAFSAKDGFSGLYLAQKIYPDLIICDINMPFLNGFDVLKKLREDLETAKTPFIFLTADTDPKNRVMALQFGANDYLTKPVDIHELLDSISHQFNWQGR
jgi:DNA-binding response OmpR family regulator